MSPSAQALANRRNARRSTGPKTPAGKGPRRFERAPLRPRNRRDGGSGSPRRRRVTTAILRCTEKRLFAALTSSSWVIKTSGCGSDYRSRMSPLTVPHPKF